jgi:hypothetical protein
MQNAFSASVLLNKDGDIIQTSKTGRKIQLNGTDYALPQWDTFLTDFRTFITDLQADLAAGSSGGCTTTAPTFFTTQLVSPGAYKSTKVTNG